MPLGPHLHAVDVDETLERDKLSYRTTVVSRRTQRTRPTDSIDSIDYHRLQYAAPTAESHPTDAPALRTDVSCEPQKSEYHTAECGTLHIRQHIRRRRAREPSYAAKQNTPSMRTDERIT